MKHHVDILAIACLLLGFAALSTARRAAHIRVTSLDRLQLSNGAIRTLTDLPRNLSLIRCLDQ